MQNETLIQNVEQKPIEKLTKSELIALVNEQKEHILLLHQPSLFDDLPVLKPNILAELNELRKGVLFPQETSKSSMPLTRSVIPAADLHIVKFGLDHQTFVDLGATAFRMGLYSDEIFRLIAWNAARTINEFVKSN